MLPQALIDLIRGSTKVTIISDHAKCVRVPKSPSTTNFLPRVDDYVAPPTSLPPPTSLLPTSLPPIPTHRATRSYTFPSIRKESPSKGKSRWDESMTNDTTIGEMEEAPVSAEPALKESGVAAEVRQKSSMGLNLPVRRLSTDSIDEILMSDIFDDLSLPDDDDSEKCDTVEDEIDCTRQTATSHPATSSSVAPRKNT